MKYKITLQGRTYEVEVEHGEAILLDEYDAVAPTPAAVQAPLPSAAPAEKQKTDASDPGEGTPVKSPLPGSVISILVKEGDAVKSGQVLMLIEAMKMENEVLAPSDGVVKKIPVSQGAMVAAGDTLIVL